MNVAIVLFLERRRADFVPCASAPQVKGTAAQQPKTFLPLFQKRPNDMTIERRFFHRLPLARGAHAADIRILGVSAMFGEFN